MKKYNERAFIVSTNKELSKFKKSGSVKFSDYMFPRQELYRHLEKAKNLSSTEQIPENKYKLFFNMLSKLPKTIKVELWFQVDNPNVIYLVFNFPNIDSERYEKNLHIHPISLITLNSWIFVNNMLRGILRSQRIQYTPDYINILKFENVQREYVKKAKKSSSEELPFNAAYGRNFIRYVGEADLEWIAKHKNKLFSDNKKFNEFYYDQLYKKSFPGTRNYTYDDYWRYAIYRANQDVFLKKFSMNSQEYEDAVARYFIEHKKHGIPDSMEDADKNQSIWYE